jgi:arsenate reductase
LQDRGITPAIIDYINNPLSETELVDLLNQLKLSAIDLIRKKDPLFRAQSLDKNVSEAECLQAMLKEPRLIERPIVITPEGACVARPPERLLEILPHV